MQKINDIVKIFLGVIGVLIVISGGASLFSAGNKNLNISNSEASYSNALQVVEDGWVILNMAVKRYVA